MSDTERLNLVEHYKWKLSGFTGDWTIEAVWGFVYATSLRKVIDAASAAQIKWSRS